MKPVIQCTGGKGLGHRGVSHHAWNWLVEDTHRHCMSQESPGHIFTEAGTLGNVRKRNLASYWHQLCNVEAAYG